MSESLFYPNKHDISTYHGSCHCGAVSFTFSLPTLSTISVCECNCSICDINGYLNVYPFRKDFTLETGEDKLSVYRFGSKFKQHKFCKVCGTSLLIDFGEQPADGEPQIGDINPYMAVNIRTVEDIDRSTLETVHVDGKNRVQLPA